MVEAVLCMVFGAIAFYLGHIMGQEHQVRKIAAILTIVSERMDEESRLKLLLCMAQVKAELEAQK